MKKIVIALISIALAISLIACTNQEKPNNENNNGVINPISSSSIKEIEKNLELSGIKFDKDIKVNSISKIDGEPIIYSIEITNNEEAYDLRICKEYENGDADISGVYSEGKIAGAIFDSENEYIAPSASCEASSSGTKAYSNWMGYYISLSTDKRVNLDEFQGLYNNLAIGLLNSKLPRLIFEKANSEGNVNIEYDTGEYKIKSIDGKPMIVFGEVAYSIKDAIDNNAIVPEQIVALCGTPSEVYKDGGSKVYELDDCTVVNMNTLDGNKDIIIGPKGTDLYSK